MFGRWRQTPEVIAERRAALDAIAERWRQAQASRQLCFDFEAEAPACEACEGELEVDCSKCQGQGCRACDDFGRVDCACEGGEVVELDDDEPEDPE